jgi:hypothetical protein
MHRILLLHPVIFTDEFEERYARPLVAVPDCFTPVLFVLVFAEPGYGSAAPIYETMIIRSLSYLPQLLLPYIIDVVLSGIRMFGR